MRVGLLIWVALFPCLLAQAQPDMVSLKGHYGFLMPHHSRMKYLLQDHVGSADLAIGWTSDGRKKYQERYSYPERGICALYSTFGNPEELGFGIGLMPYIKFKWVDLGMYQFRFRLGCGVGYVSKHFERLTNYKNVAMGSHFHVAFDMNFENNFRLSENIQLTTGLSFSHFSNGAIRQPNMGLNLVRWNVGLLYKLREIEIVSSQKTDDQESEFKNYWQVGITGGFKEGGRLLGPLYPVSSVMLEFFHVFNDKNHLGICADFFYDGSLVPLEGGKPADAFQQGVCLAYGMPVGNTTFILQFGPYIHKSRSTEGKFYDRLVVRQKLTGNLSGAIALKSHFAQADYIELGLVYRIGKR
ncbi:MAG: acyloxyacyl hydrolase [Bacteroidetes bacterium]|nr:acyloxyacyl hydrolase [Bacteroidota bacterium]MBU1717592.1 acyloxyacyl hydrolase [Bacteroidota bacterium]